MFLSALFSLCRCRLSSRSSRSCPSILTPAAGHRRIRRARLSSGRQRRIIPWLGLTATASSRRSAQLTDWPEEFELTGLILARERKKRGWGGGGIGGKKREKKGRRERESDKRERGWVVVDIRSILDAWWTTKALLRPNRKRRFTCKKSYSLFNAHITFFNRVFGGK